MNDRANQKTDTGPTMELVPTPVGPAGITWYRAPGPARAVALLGHGTAQPPEWRQRTCKRSPRRCRPGESASHWSPSRTG